MKKFISIVIAIATVASMLLVSASALTIIDAEEYDTCTSGGAGIEVKFLNAEHAVDGVVSEGEYYEISYDAVKDFYSYYIGAAFDAEEKEAYLKAYTKDNMKVYASWDGAYFYFALTGKAVEGDYSCPSAADAVTLFRYWCLQLGFAAGDASGAGSRYEIGIGASSDTIGDVYFQNWGTKTFKSFKNGENYSAMWDRAAETVTYEVKVDIKEITGAAPENNSTMRFLYLLSQSGTITAGSDGSDNIQIQSSYGCAAAKDAGQYLLVNFTGKPDNADITTAPEVTDPFAEEEQEGYRGKIECRDSATVDEFNLSDGSTKVEYKADDNGDRYIRFTALKDKPTVGGKKLPSALNADEQKFLAIHYRTSSSKAEFFGLNYTSAAITELDESNIYYNDIELGCDGEWHTIVLDMTGAAGWSQFISNLTFYFFDGAKESPVGDSIDIMWVKYYAVMPVFDDEYYPDYGSDTTVGNNDTTVALSTEEPGETTEAPKSDTTVDNKAVTTKPADDGKDTAKGMLTWQIILIIVGVVAVIAVVVVIILKSKKK